MKQTKEADVVLPKYPGHPGITAEPVEGQICYNSWGWDQTNIDYYLVEKVTPKSVRIVELESETREVGFMQGPTWPKFPLVRRGEAQTRRWKSDGYLKGQWGANMKYGCLLPWDGKEPLRCSWYA